MIINRTEEIRKYCKLHPDRTVQCTRDWLGRERTEVVYPDGKIVIVKPDSLFPE
ncbi:hypothetical protein M0R72_11080 [Candidatus Pacearchaeota archaeon]|nr:hypothetical protein [Candidatus Pacearchaeota archaeon]